MYTFCVACEHVYNMMDLLRVNNRTVSDVKLDCLQHEVVPRFLSEKLMEQNRQKNIPPLTDNQKSLIARLVWYQEGYEQPSEEDLKRVTQVNIND